MSNPDDPKKSRQQPTVAWNPEDLKSAADEDEASSAETVAPDDSDAVPPTAETDPPASDPPAARVVHEIPIRGTALAVAAAADVAYGPSQE